MKLYLSLKGDNILDELVELVRWYEEKMRGEGLWVWGHVVQGELGSAGVEASQGRKI